MKAHLSTIKPRIVRKARSSPCRSKIVAVGIDHRGRIVGIKSNTRRFMSSGGGWHAEERVMFSSPLSLRRILIARVNKRGKFRPIDPCEKCARLAAKRGIVIESI